MEVCLFSRSARGSIHAAATRDVGFTTDDWLHALFFHRVVKRDGAKHVAMVGHGTSGHAEFLSSFCKRFDLYGTVKKTVVGMKV